jgi:hypothetical protein
MNSPLSLSTPKRTPALEGAGADGRGSMQRPRRRPALRLRQRPAASAPEYVPGATRYALFIKCFCSSSDHDLICAMV